MGIHLNLAKIHNTSEYDQLLPRTSPPKCSSRSDPVVENMTKDVEDVNVRLRSKTSSSLELIGEITRLQREGREAIFRGLDFDRSRLGALRRELERTNAEIKEIKREKKQLEGILTEERKLRNEGNRMLLEIERMGQASFAMVD
jgi:hypothetical protein